MKKTSLIDTLLLCKYLWKSSVQNLQMCPWMQKEIKKPCTCKSYC